MNFLLGLSRGIDWFTTKLGQVMWWLTVFMVLIGSYNVITRYLGQYIGVQLSSNTYLEMQTYAYALIFLLGAAYVLKADAHVRVDILFSQLSARKKAWVDIFGALVFLIPFCIMGIVFSLSFVEASWRQQEVSSSPGGLPFYPLKTVIPVAFGLLILQAVSELIKNTAFLAGHPESRSTHARDETSPGENVTGQTEAL